MRLVEKIKGWDAWEIYDWPFRILIGLLILSNVLHIIVEPRLLLFDIIPIIMGFLSLYVLYKITKPYFVSIWKLGIGKIGLTFFSLGVVAIARVMADYQIVTTTNAPASLFPRAHEVLTLLFSGFIWLNMSIGILGVWTFLAQIGWILFYFIGLNFKVKFATARGHLALKIFISGFVVIFMFATLSDNIKRMRFTVSEHAIVWTSFIENSAVPFHLIPPALGPRPTGYPSALKICPLQPKDAWVALVKDDEVMVAIQTTGKDTRSAFTYFWGKCGSGRSPHP